MKGDGGRAPGEFGEEDEVTEERRHPVRVTVLTRTGCPACALAEREVARICAEAGVGWTALDVDATVELRAEYGDRVPVIMVDGREHGFWNVEERRLRAALAR